MSARCNNCGHPVPSVPTVVADLGPSYCGPCIRAITMVVDVVASRLVADILRAQADEAARAIPPVVTVVPDAGLPPAEALG